MNEIEQKLWAEVYAAEYGRLCARAAANGDKPDPRGHTSPPDWQYGCASTGDSAQVSAATRADTAVKMFRDTAKTGVDRDRWDERWAR